MMQRAGGGGGAAANTPGVVDLSEDHLSIVKKAAAQAFDTQVQGAHVYGELAKRIRADVEKLTGEAGWSVIVGREFGAGVTHGLKRFAHFMVPQAPGVNILVWRA